MPADERRKREERNHNSRARESFLEGLDKDNWLQRVPQFHKPLRFAISHPTAVRSEVVRIIAAFGKT